MSKFEGIGLLNQSVKNSNSSRFLVVGLIFSLLSMLIILLISLFFYLNKVSGDAAPGGELGPSYFRVYVYGAVPNEGFQVAKFNSTKVSDLATAAGANFVNDYYLYAGLTAKKTFKKFETTQLNGENCAVFYFPPTNALNSFSLNEVTENQLLYLGLNELAVQKLLAYRAENGAFAAKQQLLEKQILTETQYRIVYANLYCVPVGYESLFVSNGGL